MLQRSLCKKQALREWPFHIDPLRSAVETGAFAHFRSFVAAIFVRAFGPDGFVFCKCYIQSSRRNAHCLAPYRAQMHFHSPVFIVISNFVLEESQVEIRVEFA